MINKKSFFKSALASLGLAFAAFSAPAHAEFLDFTVDEAPIGGGGKIFTADKLTGGYNEVFTYSPDFSSFSTAAYGTFDGFYANEGANKISGIGLGLGPIYSLYAVFYATGKVVSGGFQGLTGSIQLFMDKYADGVATSLSLPGSGNGTIARGNSADDILLASTSSFVFGNGSIKGGGLTSANGDYSLVFKDFTLTEDGSRYFVAPNPFHMNVAIDGNFSAFTPTSDPLTFNTTGASNAFFSVPEPGMLALLGIGLLGFGMSKRRRS